MRGERCRTGGAQREQASNNQIEGAGQSGEKEEGIQDRGVSHRRKRVGEPEALGEKWSRRTGLVRFPRRRRVEKYMGRTEGNLTPTKLKMN